MHLASRLAMGECRWLWVSLACAVAGGVLAGRWLADVLDLHRVASWLY